MTLLHPPRLLFFAMLGVACLSGCDSDSESPPASEDPPPVEDPPPNGGPDIPGLPKPSFDVNGIWKGTATDTNTSLKITVIFDNNGGPKGSDLSGKVELEGLANSPLPFSAGVIEIHEGATRFLRVEGADGEGYKWSLSGTVTSKRMDDGQFVSDNPIVGVDHVLLDTKLLKQ